MEHITTLSLHIEPQSSGEHPSWRPSFLGPMLQSVLMEHVDDDYAAQLTLQRSTLMASIASWAKTAKSSGA